MLYLYHKGQSLLELDIPVSRLSELPVMGRARRLKTAFANDRVEDLKGFRDEIRAAFDQLRDEYSDEGAPPPEEMDMGGEASAAEAPSTNSHEVVA